MHFLDTAAPYLYLVVLAVLAVVMLQRAHDVAWTPLLRGGSNRSFELTTADAVATVVETRTAFGTPAFASVRYPLAEPWEFDLCLRRWPYHRGGFPTGFDAVDRRIRIHAESERLIDALQADAGLRAQLIFSETMLRRHRSRLMVINAEGRTLRIYYKLPWSGDHRALHRDVVEWASNFDRMLQRM
jgi:hypothetical protein